PHSSSSSRACRIVKKPWPPVARPSRRSARLWPSSISRSPPGPRPAPAWSPSVTPHARVPRGSPMPGPPPPRRPGASSRPAPPPATRLAGAGTAAGTAAAPAREAADRAATHEAEQRRRRNAGLAAELAYGLAEGDPCPVCGATAHPEPAETGADHVDAETVETAEEERRVADAAHQSAREHLTLARSKHEQALELAGGLSVEDAETAQHEAAAAVEAITAQQAEATRLEKILEEHDEHD